MRELDVSTITPTVARLCQQANYELDDDVRRALERAIAEETDDRARDILEKLIENADIAAAEQMPLCQDTGLAVVFVKLGQEVQLVGGSLHEAINEGVREGYEEGYLRKSALNDPLERVNTGDNTPAVVHVEIVPGDAFEIVVATKGGGSENMSTVQMLTPAVGREGVVEFVTDWVKQAGGKPCPPVIVGVGLGGTFEKAALLAKTALLREVGEASPDSDTADLERELLARINETDVGPMGMGGRTTALAVHVLRHPCHIASLPCAVNVQCHAHRHRSATL
ncbi:MAG: fumarate hydratase [Armatimonadota bacterium]